MQRIKWDWRRPVAAFALGAVVWLQIASAAPQEPYTWSDVAKWPDFTTGTWLCFSLDYFRFYSS